MRFNITACLLLAASLLPYHVRATPVLSNDDQTDTSQDNLLTLRREIAVAKDYVSKALNAYSLETKNSSLPGSNLVTRSISFGHTAKKARMRIKIARTLIKGERDGRHGRPPRYPPSQEGSRDAPEIERVYNAGYNVGIQIRAFLNREVSGAVHTEDIPLSDLTEEGIESTESPPSYNAQRANRMLRKALNAAVSGIENLIIIAIVGGFTAGAMIAVLELFGFLLSVVPVA